MARKVDSLPAKAGPPGIYPWAEWFDGSTWELIQGEDFTCQRSSFRAIAGQAAKRRGLILHSRTPGEKIILLQAVPRD